MKNNKVFNLLYVLTVLIFQSIILFFFLMSSIFYILSNIYSERYISLKYLVIHILIDVCAVFVTILIYKFFDYISKNKINKKLYILTLIQLSIYYMSIFFNGILDSVSKGNIYLKPIIISIEFIIYLIFLYKAVKVLRG